jgi:tRNA G10  N-methylase Trm11
VVLYDPVCGSGALLVTVAFLHGRDLAGLIGSDANLEALSLAERNLKLLTPAGLDARLDELRALHDQFGKESHTQAIESVCRLRRLLVDPPIPTHLFQADATDPGQIRRGIDRAVDIVIADVPYGVHSAWSGGARGANADPLRLLLEAIRPVLAPEAVVAIASDKAQRARHDAYVRREWFQVGKRRIELLSPGT